MMGTAACVPWVDAGHDVRLVGTPLDASILALLRQTRRHPGLGVEVPATLRCFDVGELPAAVSDADALVLGVSSAGVDWAARSLAPQLAERARPVLMLSKGLELRGATLAVLTDAFEQGLERAGARLKSHAVAVCGPCIAGELARRVPSLVVFTSRDSSEARRFADWVKTPYYHVDVQADAVGVQLCAALKNAFAMGVGLGAGLHARAGGERGSVAMHNYEAAVFARAVIEMELIVTRLGGAASTALGLSGSGDLMVTCNGGRTGRFGALLGRGHDCRQAVAEMQGATLECLEVLGVLDRFMAEPSSPLRRNELPLLNHLIAIALHGEALEMPFGDFTRT